MRQVWMRFVAWCTLGAVIGGGTPWALPPAHADGPADNLPDTVRPIPPPGIPLDEATQRELLDGADALVRQVEALAGADHANQAEVLVFARAVRLAVEDQMLYTPAEIDDARFLLAHGRERATRLAQGAAGLQLAGVAAGASPEPRPLAGGFRSRIDGSVQPYGLVWPAGCDPGDSRPRRLDVWLHGRGEKLSEVAFLRQRMRAVGEIAPPGTIVLHPYGRYCNAFKFAGEVDVLEAIDHVASRLAVDPDRVTIRGFSMGGAGCWQLAVHHPGTWMAATPGAGFSETREFLRVFQQEDFQPDGAQRRLLHWYDCPDWADNLRHLPTIAYSGEVDRQKQAADVMVAACAERGFALPHVIGPQAGHVILPESKAEIETFLDRAAVAGRQRVPRQVDFTTWTLRYPRHSWLTIEGLDEHWRRARVRAAIAAADRIEVETENVSALRIAIPRDAEAIAADGEVTVRIEGAAIRVAVEPGPGDWRATFRRSPEGWRPGGPEPGDGGLRKRPGLQGPIDDAFLDPFVFVGPATTAAADSATERWIGAEYARATREWRRHFRGDVVERRADEVTAADIATRHLVLFGTARSNPLVARVLPGLPLKWDAGECRLGDHRAAAAEAVPVLVYPNPLNPDRYVVLNSGFTFREYAYLNNARQVPMLPDWALVSVLEGRGTQWPGRLLASGFFDERWQPR